jgi:hypothetical protein|nr:MAG: hypothetical protein [Bacteriophage sp.]
MEAVMALQEFTNPVKSRDDIDEQVGYGEG